jgi:hypothetical protein
MCGDGWRNRRLSMKFFRGCMNALVIVAPFWCLVAVGIYLLVRR